MYIAKQIHVDNLRKQYHALDWLYDGPMHKSKVSWCDHALTQLTTAGEWKNKLD